MTKIQQKIKPDTDPKIVTDLFHQHFDKNTLDKLIIARVISSILYILRTYCTDKQIQTLFLSIDGVPSKGKMIEQKQRRYMSSIVESYKEKILESYKEYLQKQPDYFYIAEKYKITWTKGNITPSTNFMHKLCTYLRSDSIQEKLSKNRPKLKIVLSDMYEVGEGEKKIINYINKYIDNKDSICIYSPDADMILLAMLLETKKVFYLRFNQQDLWHDLIDINLLKNNIAFYINNHPKYAKAHFETDRINYDIIFLSTFFGNDFVPKMETINVKAGFQSIMDAYLSALLELKDKNYYLIKTPSKSEPTFRINFTFLKLVIHKLLPIEEDFIKNNDLYNRYIKIGTIKSAFDYMEINSDNLVSTLNDFRNEYENLKRAIKNNQSLSYYETHDEFMNSLKKVIRIEIDGQTANVTYLTNKELIALLKKNFKSTKDFPRLMISLDTYSKSITDRHIANQLKQKENKQGRIMNAYEKELYKFEHMLDQYQVKFNASPLQLTKDKIGNYYETYFDVKVSEADTIAKDYFEGLDWVMQFYYNDPTYISTYYYKYEKAPLLKHISAYLDKITREEFVAVTAGLEKYQVTNLKTYFAPIYQLIYVSPMVPEVLQLLPSNYRKAIKSGNISPFLKKYFVDVDKIVDKLYKEPVSSEVDCHSIPYLNKCLVRTIHRATAEDDKKFLHDIKEILPSETSERRNQNKFPKY